MLCSSRLTKAFMMGLIVLLAVFLALPRPARAEVEIKVIDFAFVPRDTTIPVGETVKWVWEDGSHTTTNGTGADDPDAGLLWDELISGSNPTFSYQFTEEGFFPYFCRPHEFFDMKGTITVETAAGIGDGPEKNAGDLPRAAGVSQNFPNPFNPSTTFTVRIPGGENRLASLRIYTLRGAIVKTIFEEALHGGEFTFSWNGRTDAGESLPSGIYIYRLQFGDQVISKKMTMLK
jgi:plastocyanin